MNVELIALFSAVIVGLLQVSLASSAATRERGVQWNLSSRDKQPPPLSLRAARYDRALQNFKETFPFFFAAIFIVLSTGRTGNLSAISASVYVIARIAYVPIYVLNITVVRTLVWMLATLGILGVLAQVLISS